MDSRKLVSISFSGNGKRTLHAFAENTYIVLEKY